jgi:hypothetical protein
MSMMTRDTSETSVTFSLAELAKIEAERVREEEAQRARARDRDAREKRETEAQRREAEAQRLAAEADAKARRAREEAIENARIEARERASLDVARIQAQARIQLDADNAQRAHEIAMMRARAEGGARRLRAVLAVVLGVGILGGGGAAISVSRQVTALEQEAAQLREGQTALGREREHAKANELAALDRRHAALRARAETAVAEGGTLGIGRDADEALRAAGTACASVDAKALDHDRLRAFGDALDTLEARVETLEKVTALDRRIADLDAWAAERRKLDAATTAKTAAAKSAATRARATGAGEDAVRAYAAALGQLHEALAQSGGRGGQGKVTSAPAGPDTRQKCTPGADPLCGPDGFLLR